MEINAKRPEICWPEYKRSILSVTASVLSHYGAQCPHDTLPELDAQLSKGYKNVVLMVFDGLGAAILEKHLPPTAFLRRKTALELSTVFPSTTTAATVSLETGLSPGEHGWLGWSLFFEEIGANVSLFPNTLSGSGGLRAADYHVARRLLPYTDIFEKIPAAAPGTGAERVSPYSAHESKSVGDICDSVREICARPGRQFVYAYWPQPDYDMHDLGTEHEKIREHVLWIDHKAAELCAGLADSIVLITADHGLIDTEWRFVKDFPGLDACLSRPPSVETRAAALFVKSGMEPEFEREFEKAFGEEYILMPSREALERGLFGPGVSHPRAAGFAGDYFAIAAGRVSMGYEHDDKPFKAAHAGLTRDEMRVPLIVAECG